MRLGSYFKRRSDRRLFSSPRIEALAKELVEELKGLPLALVTVGRAMYGKSNPKQWESAMHYMKQSCCGGDYQDLHMENMFSNNSGSVMNL
jgi:disease resistance protein RPS2